MSEEEIRILKMGSCPSLSGRSTLTYHIGCKGNGTVHLSIYENSGKGLFNKDWTPLALVDPLLTSGDKPVTAGLIRTRFKKKSVNTGGFLIAALIAEGLLKVSKENPQSYERVDPTEFKKSIQALTDSDIPKGKPGEKTKKPE